MRHFRHPVLTETAPFPDRPPLTPPHLWPHPSLPMAPPLTSPHLWLHPHPSSPMAPLLTPLTYGSTPYPTPSPMAPPLTPPPHRWLKASAVLRWYGSDDKQASLGRRQHIGNMYIRKIPWHTPNTHNIPSYLTFPHPHHPL